MKYLVHGIITQVVSVEVEAAFEEEAVDAAVCMSPRDFDVWDSDFTPTGVTPG